MKSIPEKKIGVYDIALWRKKKCSDHLIDQ